MKPIIPARSPSTSITKRPSASGSASERSISSRIEASSVAVARPRNGSTSSWPREAGEEVDVLGRGSSDRDAHAGCGSPPAEPHGARAERDAAEDQHEPAELGHRDRLAEEEDAVDERERRQQVRDERASATGRGSRASGRGRAARAPCRGSASAATERDRLPARQRRSGSSVERERQQQERGRRSSRPPRAPGPPTDMRRLGDRCRRRRRRSRTGPPRACPPPPTSRRAGRRRRASRRRRARPGRRRAAGRVDALARQRTRIASSATKIGTVAFADRGHAGVDVLLAPGDQRERDRGVERAEHEPRAPGAAQLAAAVSRPRWISDEAEQERRREQEPQLDHRAPARGRARRP